VLEEEEEEEEEEEVFDKQQQKCGGVQQDHNTTSIWARWQTGYSCNLKAPRFGDFLILIGEDALARRTGYFYPLNPLKAPESE